MRLRASQLGSDFKIHFLDASEKVLFARLADRNAQLPQGAVYITESKLKEWTTIFEPLFPEELEYSCVYPQS